MAKFAHKSPKSLHVTNNPDQIMALRQKNLTISIYSYQLSTPCHLPQTQRKESLALKYTGTMLFVDNALS